MLNTGFGDSELRCNPESPEEVQKAKETITDMLKRGYAIFVRKGKETFRVRKFDPDKSVYIIGSTPAEEVPIAVTNATAVCRSAGVEMGEDAEPQIGKDLLTLSELSRHLGNSLCNRLGKPDAWCKHGKCPRD